MSIIKKGGLLLVGIVVVLAMLGFTFNRNNKKRNYKKKIGNTISSVQIDQSTIDEILAQAGNLNPKVLHYALVAYSHAKQMGLDSKNIITIIDYSKPSTEKRLYVINLNNDKVLFDTYVAHGKNSGTKYATHFSNKRGSDASSIGVYITGKSYYGHDGYSLRLHGQDKGYNSAVYKRDVVMHGAWYVSKSFIKAHGYLGRSWGCPAVNKKLIRPIVNTIKNGTVILGYYPNYAWLHSSKFLV